MKVTVQLKSVTVPGNVPAIGLEVDAVSNGDNYTGIINNTYTPKTKNYFMKACLYVAGAGGQGQQVVATTEWIPLPAAAVLPPE